ncbi:SDR family NAD(P)-dependent oxidoreductase [Psychromonas sp.]|uniref:SDR family NAD(P)-dependent oxidoreductase n=1 Tax=Psychromonas sp. TaxID=1884585 RepID=UPI003563F25E
MKTVILFGAGSTIAQAYIAHLEKQSDVYQVICISSAMLASSSGDSKRPSSGSTMVTEHYQTDYSPESLKNIVADIAGQHIELHQVIIFNGQLHHPDTMPEKKLEEINRDYFNRLMHSNALVPMLCLQSLMSLLSHKTHCTITALSARVGSIQDNRSGGWYSYRASKAALNMLFKSAAIELARRAKNSQLILFHPGTTDTPLSRPFQKNVPAGKLFSPAFAAEQLFELTNNNPDLTADGEPVYIDWQGKRIPW